ncbi:DUF6457 domain-containing protein [Conexibacter sp. DBS9H8]|uniref:DUF6457 domain-containing protein n=1 Tax=Conexibacter sp. DBS9H8 TaxID=2937801 RepID=UPI00200D047B|nr:DUF6457 domain-containing protein [Conexibacter sp. DBS9H8]
MTAPEWIAAFARELEIAPPSPEEVDHLLALAGVAAHASARQAAPICTWLAARAGVEPARALASATALAERLGADAAGTDTAA